jgi:hypothetical protein
MAALRFAWLAPLLAGAVPVSPVGSAPNLCKAAPLSAIRQAAGQHYGAGISANGTCTWTRADLKAGLTLSTHPRAQGIVLMRQFLARGARRVAVPGATEAVVVELAGPTAKGLFVAYPRIVVQVNMSAPRKVPDTRLLAVAKLVAGKV